MDEVKSRIFPIPIEDEIKESYLNYAMSVIVARALPDVRDGLKPVHRRILYSMSEMGLRHDRAYKKCGRIVGDVLGKFHPHGDQAIYDSLVRLAQEFSLRIPVVQGQGNFGSIDGDPPAAMRYTEARLARVAEAMLQDIKKETVDFVPNYDDSMVEPSILPTLFPFHLVNGASGIAVGMATNLPPHNLGEVCDALAATIENPEISIFDLVDNYISGPDFPTAATICGYNGYRKAALTGRGRVVIRANCTFEESGDKEKIIVTELPYMVNKAQLIVRIAELVKDKKVEGIADLRDESDRQGMRIVIELKRSVSARVILNQLYLHTSLQTSFHINNLVLVDGRPKLCNLKELLTYFIAHRKEVVTRRSLFDLNKAKERAHILEGLKKALDNIDEVIRIIKESENVNIARAGLITRFEFSEKQAQAILDMRLQRLTSLETKKIVDELEEVRRQIVYLEELLSNEGKMYQLIKEEILSLKEKFSSPRKSVISIEEAEVMDNEDLIEKEDMVVLLSRQGYVKRISLDEYREQGRGGKGAASASLRDEDYVEHIFIGNTHNYIMFVTSRGKAYWLKVYEIPQGSKTAKGRHIHTILEFEQGEEITTAIELNDFTESTYLFMATKRGIVKRVGTEAFRNARRRGIKAIDLRDDDHLITAMSTHGEDEVLLVSGSGKGLRFHEAAVRAMGRTAAGVRGIKLAEGDSLVGVCRVKEDEKMLLVSEQGLGKRTEFSEFQPHGRGTQGQKAYNINEKSGPIIAALSIHENDRLICITSQGKAIKLNMEQVSTQGRNASGVRIVNVGGGDSLIGVARVEVEESAE